MSFKFVGLGREYACLLASRGAKVVGKIILYIYTLLILFIVVNDLGVEATGLGENSLPADEVVATIKSMGGTAVPNYGNGVLESVTVVCV